MRVRWKVGQRSRAVSLLPRDLSDKVRLDSSEAITAGRSPGGPVGAADPRGLDAMDDFLRWGSNFFGGWGDALTFGGTDLVREAMGTNEYVDRDSGWYAGGEAVGFVHKSLLGGPKGRGRFPGFGAPRSNVRPDSDGSSFTPKHCEPLGKAPKLKSLVRAAQEKYPKLAGKEQDHHITPKYLGGDRKGPTVRIDAAYHQMITNLFRQKWGYGLGRPSPARLRDILREVYDDLPLP